MKSKDEYEKVKIWVCKKVQRFQAGIDISQT